MKMNRMYIDRNSRNNNNRKDVNDVMRYLVTMGKNGVKLTRYTEIFLTVYGHGSRSCGLILTIFALN